MNLGHYKTQHPTEPRCTGWVPMPFGLDSSPRTEQPLYYLLHPRKPAACLQEINPPVCVLELCMGHSSTKTFTLLSYDKLYSRGIQICSVNRGALTKPVSITGSHRHSKGRWLKLTKENHAFQIFHKFNSSHSFLYSQFFFPPAPLAWFQLHKLKSPGNQGK